MEYNLNNSESISIEEFGSNTFLMEGAERNSISNFPVIEERMCEENKFENETIIKAIGNQKEYIYQESITNSEIKELLEGMNMYIKFEDDKIKKSYSIIEDDYLSVDDTIIDTKNLKHDFNIFLQKFEYNSDLLSLKKQIERSPIDNSYNNKIGPVSSLDFLVETSFNSDESRKKSIIENLVSLEDIIYRWRKVAGDGNCFYRAVIFGYLENIIFSQNIPLLQYLILDIYKIFNNEEYLIKKMDEQGIKRDLIFKILVLLFYSLSFHIDGSSKDIMQTYELYLKCYNSCKAFDIGLIFYFRFKLFQFIKANNDKLYTKEFSVKIGNLLPSEYETDDGQFLYEKFYEDYLMKLYKDAEKIVIYLTPFVLKINLNILIYDFGKNYVDKLKEFQFPINNLKNISTVILLYKGTHYDLIYEQKYFEQFTKYLTQYVNLSENLKVINRKLLEEVEKIKNSEREKDHEILFKINNEKKDLQMSVDNYIDINMFNLTQTSFMPNKNKNKNKNISESIIIDDLNSKEDYLIHINSSTKCFLCNKDFIQLKSDIYLCKSCLIGEIKSNTLTKYLLYLQTTKFNFKDKKDPSDAVQLFKIIFNDTLLKIQDNLHLSQTEAFKLIDSDFYSFLIKEVKSNICVYCENPFNTNTSTLSFFILPCNCHLCSGACIKGFFNLLFTPDIKYRINDFICICSSNYNTNDLKQLYSFCHSNNAKTNKEKILEVFKERISNQCMLCLQETNFKLKDGNKKSVVVCELQDSEIEKFTQIKSFNHYLCHTCFRDHFPDQFGTNSKNKNYNKFEINESQFCMICNSNHRLLNCKINSSPGKLKTSSECKIY